MYFRLIITGQDDVRKTNLLLRGLPRIRLRAGGFVFSSFDGMDEKNMALVTPGEVLAIPLSYSIYKENNIKKENVWDERIYEEKFLENVEKAEEKGIGIFAGIDSQIFVYEQCGRILTEFMQKTIPCAATLCGTLDTEEKYKAFFKMLNEDENTCLLYVDEYSDKELLAILAEWEEEAINWVQHQKFDPLARPRFRTDRRYP